MVSVLIWSLAADQRTGRHRVCNVSLAGGEIAANSQSKRSSAHPRQAQDQSCRCFGLGHDRGRPSPRRSPRSKHLDGISRPRKFQPQVSSPEFLDTLPIDLQPETRRLGQVHHAIADLGPAAVNRVVQRVAGRVAVRFSGERGIAERRDQMSVQMPHRMRCDQHAFLFGIVRDPQRFGESGMPRGIELHVTDRAGVDEIADGVAVPLPLAVRQRNG